MDLIYMSFFYFSNPVLVTTIVTLIFIAAVIISIFVPRLPSPIRVLNGFLCLLLVTGVVVCMFNSPKVLIVNKSGLVVKNIIGSRFIPSGQIQSIEIIDGSELSGSVRTFGSGGLFGYLGRFKNKKLGRYSMYATSRDEDMVAVSTTDRLYIFSSENPEELVNSAKTILRLWSSEEPRPDMEATGLEEPSDDSDLSSGR